MCYVPDTDLAPRCYTALYLLRTLHSNEIIKIFSYLSCTVQRKINKSITVKQYSNNYVLFANDLGENEQNRQRRLSKTSDE